MAPPGVSALHDQCPLHSLVTEGIVSASSDAPGHCWWSSGERCGFLLHARSWWGRVEEGVEWNSCAESWIVDPKIETRDCCGGVLAKRTSHFQINCDCAETEKKDNAFYGLATNRRKITKISATSITTWSVSVGHLSIMRLICLPSKRPQTMLQSHKAQLRSWCFSLTDTANATELCDITALRDFF